MVQNESMEEVKEKKEDEEIGWGDVQEEMKASAKPVEEKEVEEKEVEKKEVEKKEVEKKEVEKKEVEEKKVEKKEVEEKEDEEIGWGDVQEEMKASTKPVEKKEVSNVSFDEIKKGETKKTSLDIDFILDLPLSVTVELGKTKMMISELLQLGQGSVVELTKFAGEPMEVFVNNRLIARGEVVVVNEKFGVRLTNVVSHAERLDRLK